jgi:hypothetical protein
VTEEERIAAIELIADAERIRTMDLAVAWERESAH